VRKVIHRAGRIRGAVGVAVMLAGSGLAGCGLAGCGLAGAGGPAAGTGTGPPVTLTQDAAPSALLAVTDDPASGPVLAGLVAATARPNEDLTILRAGTPPRAIVSSDSPPPRPAVIPGRPAAPGGGETPYQSALYAKRLKRWHAEAAAGRRAGLARTRQAVAAWLRGLGIVAKLGQPGDPPAGQGSLAAESAAAASALAGLEEAAGGRFGSRRVIVLYCDELTGTLPAGELTGDEVIVITPFVPGAAAASAAQAGLLGAGAAQAAVLGPEATAGQLAGLVSADLSQDARPESVSAPVLFANGSASLRPGAVRQLTRFLARLREAGVTAVINGYASTPGPAGANYALSYRRAANVASFFEARGIPGSALVIVGHGASDLIAPGTSGLNRRVTVVTEEPARGS